MLAVSAPGIYIHVPFCEKKCPYCNFYSQKADEATFDRYTEKICRMLASSPEKFAFPQKADSLYFGGGTPTLLGAPRLGKIITAAKKALLADACEITLEANPGKDLEETLKQAAFYGANRLSLGLQSADGAQLKTLGRGHTADDVAKNVKAAQNAGFLNISLDLMLALPGQDEKTVETSAAFCAGLGVQHISAYLLKIEEGTPFYTSGVRERLPDPDRQADIYLHAVKTFEKLGYPQYEISNFAPEAYQSRHNLKYWLGAPYIGLGPSAHSFFGGRRFYLPADLAGFLKSDDPFTLFIDDGAGGDVEETIMLRMRLADGIDKSEMQAAFPDYPWDDFYHKAKSYSNAGFLRETDGRLAFTPAGFLLSNSILARLL